MDTTHPNQPPISSTLIQKLRRNDAEAWHWLLTVILPEATQRIRHGFQLGAADELDQAAALLSAWTSFQRHFLDGKLGDPKNPEALAVQLIRIAHNRWERARYRDRQIREQVEHAHARNREGEYLPFDPADPSAGPAEEVIRKEVCAHLVEVIRRILEDEQVAGNPLKFRAIRAYLDAPGRRQEEIARLVGVSQSTVSRWVNNFNERIRAMLRAGEPA